MIKLFHTQLSVSKIEVQRNALKVFFVLLINVKMPNTVGILTFMSRIHFMLI